MDSLFLSYCRDDLSAIEELARILVCGGIRPWQDVKALSSGNAETEIRRALRDECFSLLFYATPASLSSDFIKTIELDEASRMCSILPSFSIVPVFTVPIAEADRALQGTMPVALSTFNGVVVGPTESLTDACVRVRRIVLKTRLKSWHATEISVAFMTQQRAPGGTSFAVSVDLATAFEAGVIIGKDFWTGYLRQGLLDLKNALLEAGISEIRLISKAHISAGLAFGFIFRRVTGFVLRVLQDGQWWSNADQPSPTRETDIFTTPNDIKSQDLAVEISVSQDTQRGIQRLLKGGRISFRALLKCVPKDGVSQRAITSSSSAVTMAKEIAETVREAQGKYGTTDTHIFAAIPLGLAYLLGSELNACGRIHLYEYNKSKGDYEESWVIEATG